MSEKMIENNTVSIIGEIVSDFTFSHEVFREGFYMTDVAVKRLSGQADIIPLMVSERLLDVHRNYIGCTIEALGQFRSYNRHEGVKNRLMLSIFVREIHFLEEFTDYTKTNQIFLDGYICKPPIYRKTPLGREIADILLAVNRSYGKSDYIPCIGWGRNARYASGFVLGTRVKIWGRVQSREYEKRLSETESETRITYEVSIGKMEVVERNVYKCPNCRNEEIELRQSYCQICGEQLVRNEDGGNLTGQKNLSPYERSKRAVYATGNRWTVENFEATHN